MGLGAVRIEVLAQALGVTKGGFYGHFADRNALLKEMLDTWERRATDEAIERAERRGGDVRIRLRRAGVLTFSAELLPIDLAVRDWARPCGPGDQRSRPAARQATAIRPMSSHTRLPSSHQLAAWLSCSHKTRCARISACRSPVTAAGVGQETSRAPVISDQAGVSCRATVALAVAPAAWCRWADPIPAG